MRSKGGGLEEASKSGVMEAQDEFTEAQGVDVLDCSSVHSDRLSGYRCTFRTQEEMNH